ncbi:unnamed protein product [Cuscuta campestris]|uniref:Tetraspanin-2 n=1 Tax=Cuscuta campestris TaxID=132261 RepID=A0A484LZ29_9ASTE|nr:unnamed protein product [Cuscuta campestris]
MSVSNNITSILNFLAFMCSIPITAAGIWLALKPGNECIHWLRWPILAIGAAILLVSLAGFCGAHRKKEGLLGVYLVCMALLIVLVLFVLVFAFVVTRPSGAYGVGPGYPEYRLDGYSSWLRNHLTGADNWGKIRACLAAGKICPKLSDQHFTADQFFAAHLSPLQSGCCKPPSTCGYQYVTATAWINPTNAASNPDCSAWNNDPTQLCYNCDSCKAGLLGNLRQEWRKANMILIVAVVVLIFVYVIACSAYKNAQTEEVFRRYKRGWT